LRDTPNCLSGTFEGDLTCPALGLDTLVGNLVQYTTAPAKWHMTARPVDTATNWQDDGEDIPFQPGFPA